MYVDVPVRPVNHLASRRPTGSTKELPSSSPLLDVSLQNRPTLRRARLPVRLMSEMSIGWKIFFVCITSIITIGLLFLMLMSVEEQDDLRYIKSRLQPHFVKARSVNDVVQLTGPEISNSKFAHPIKTLLQHPKLLDYCHRPENPVTGMEGFGPEGFELKQVHIVISSGHKAFGDIGRGLSSQLNCHLKGSQHIYPRLQSFKKAAESLSQRNIGSFQRKFNVFSSKEECESQQLLPLGISQLINLGHYLQKIYIHRWKLEKSKIKPKRLNVKSISHESSFQSVIAFLHGFLPESHFPNLKIAKARNNFCGKDSKVTSCNCAKNEEVYDLLQDAVTQGIIHSKLDIKLENKTKYSSGITGQNKMTPNKMTPKQIQHLLTTHICSKQPVPCYNSECFNTTPGFIERVFKLVDMTTKNLSQDKHFKEFSDLFMHPFISLLSYRLKNAKSLFEQLFVYSADESFILYLLTALKFPVRKSIRPASRVIFELYKNKLPENNPYYLRVLYNGEDITNTVPLCQNHLKDTVCKLKYFIDYHSIESQHKFNGENYKKLCNF